MSKIWFMATEAETSEQPSFDKSEAEIMRVIDGEYRGFDGVHMQETLWRRGACLMKAFTTADSSLSLQLGL